MPRFQVDIEYKRTRSTDYDFDREDHVTRIECTSESPKTAEALAKKIFQKTKESGIRGFRWKYEILHIEVLPLKSRIRKTLALTGFVGGFGNMGETRVASENKPKHQLRWREIPLPKSAKRKLRKAVAVH